MSIDESIQRMVKAEVDRQLEEKLPEIIRALGLHEAELESDAPLIDAEEVARMLGRDLSTPENVRKAKRHVYNLASKNLIPAVRLSERVLRFDPVKVKKIINEGGMAKAA